MSPILAWEMFNINLPPHPCLPVRRSNDSFGDSFGAGRKIGCAFFVTFFAQARPTDPGGQRK